MSDRPAEEELPTQTLFERWQDEQRKWQQLVLNYVDRASTDEAFLTNVDNSMRGSLLAGKPYPGTAAAGDAQPTAERSELDEIAFAVRRLEGQLLELTMAVDSLTATVRPQHGPASADEHATNRDETPAE